MSRPALLTILLILQLVHFGSSRFVRDSDLISDGGIIIDDKRSQPSILEVVDLQSDTVTCEPVYGFLPCATSVCGLLFLIIVYEVLLSLADQYVSAGSELFFELFGTGIFGASAFHMLGMIPQVGVVLVTGVTGSTETAEAMAEMSMGLLAGSAIMLLTLVWGSVVAFGSQDLSVSQTSSNTENKKSFSLTGYGVTTDVETKATARIMMVSLIPFLILQVAKMLSSSSGIQVVILVSLLTAFAFLVIYCIYQIMQPWIQKRRLDFVMHKYVQKNLLPSLLTVGGNPNVSIIQGLFHKLDQNNNTYISSHELRALILGIQIEEVGLDENDYAAKVMEEFDISGDSQIVETEFVNGISKWINPAKPSANDNSHEHKWFVRRNPKNEKTKEDQNRPVAKKKKAKGADKSWTNLVKAAYLLILGTGITVLLAVPLMRTMQEFSTAASIPSFLTSYVLIPLATNYRLALRSVTSAREKTDNAISLTLSEIYNGVFMNNIMGLTIFLALVYIRNLSWEVSAEALVVLIICTVMGLSTSFSRKFPFWTSIIAYILYPVSLLLVYVLTTFLGWS
ncbi:sodium/calcium exchanger NCL1-like [Prunus avium]|uniref:Sodium/calcium exchanger NCL1-like n=1 Tax=Prunus avium TaxID=42229 RepID=A0A6P5U020_PRUAV|nr:sodium/calcium exchanger NCL1-like [Prunus avium]